MKFINISSLFAVSLLSVGCATQQNEAFHRSKSKEKKEESKKEETHIVIRLKNSELKIESKEKYLCKEVQILTDQFVPNQEVQGTNGRIATGLNYVISNSDHPEICLKLEEDSADIHPSKTINNMSKWIICENGNDNQYILSNRGAQEDCGPNSTILAHEYGDIYCMAVFSDEVFGKNPIWSFIYKGFCSIVGYNQLAAILPSNVDLDKSDIQFVNTRVEKNPAVIQKWNFIPQNYDEFEFQIKNFIYDEAIYHLDDIAKNTKNVAWDYYNYAKEGKDDEYTLIVKEEIQNFTSWAFTESNERTFYEKISWGTSAEAGIKICGAYAGVKGYYDKDTEWTTKDTSITNKKEVHMDDTVKEIQQKVYVPPMKKVEVRLAWFTADVELPYTAIVYARVKADRSTQDGKFSHDYVDGPGVRSILLYLKEKLGGAIEFIGYDGLYVKTKLTGKVGVKGATRGEVYKYMYDLPNETDPVSIERID